MASESVCAPLKYYLLKMIKNLIVITGEDDFRRKERITFYKKAFAVKYPQGEIVLLEKENTIQELENSVFTPHLFGGKRLIFTEDFWNPETFEKAQKTKFFERLPDFQDQCSVIVVEGKFDKRQKSSKFLLSHGKVETFEPLDENQTIHWCLKYAQSQKGSLDFQTAQFLVGYCGRNLWNLSQEIQKLTLQNPEKITKSDIKKSSIPHPETIIWSFLEHLSARNLPQSLHHFHILLQTKTSVHEILAMVFREIRIHALLCEARERGLSASEIAQKTGLNPFVINKSLPLSKNFTLKKIEKMYDQLYEIDYKIKTGQISVSTDDASELELHLEKFILHVCKT